MKIFRRNLLILTLLLVAVCGGTLLVISNTAVPMRNSETSEKKGDYLRALKLRLIELVGKKEFAEAEIVFRRLRKIEPENRFLLRLGSVVYFRNGKLNEAENLLRNLLLRTPGDHICRNNYGAVLLAKNRREALGELRRAWLDSGKAAFIGKNFQECAKRFKIKLPEELFRDDTASPPPLDAVTLVEEKK